MRTFNSLLWIFLCLIAISCSVVEIKDDVLEEAQEMEEMDSPQTIEPTSPEAFALALHGEISKTWKASSFEMEGIGSLDCRLDDEVTLYADGTYSYDGGESLCGGEDTNQRRIGQYIIDYESKKMIFDRGTNLEAVANVTGLADNELALSGSYFLVGIRGNYQSK